MNSKKFVIGALSTAFVGALALAPSAVADPGAVTGTGADDPGMNDPSGDTSQTGDAPVGIYAEGDPAAAQGGIGVSVGSDDGGNSVGKAAVGGSQDSLVVYGEDYTDGNQIAGAVGDANAASGCAFLAPDEGTNCGDETDSDAVTVYSEAPAE